MAITYDPNLYSGDPLAMTPSGVTKVQQNNALRSLYSFYDKFGGGAFQASLPAGTDWQSRLNQHFANTDIGKLPGLQTLPDYTKRAMDGGFQGDYLDSDAIARFVEGGGYKSNASNVDVMGRDVSGERGRIRDLGFTGEWGGGNADNWLKSQMVSKGFTPSNPSVSDADEFWAYSKFGSTPASTTPAAATPAPVAAAPPNLVADPGAQAAARAQARGSNLFKNMVSNRRNSLSGRGLGSTGVW